MFSTCALCDVTRKFELNNNLGNMKIEHDSGNDASLFLGNKFYCLHCINDHIEMMKVKGVPLKTIDKDGNSLHT